MTQRYRLIPRTKNVPDDCDYAVTVENVHAEPFFSDGDIVYLDHRAELEDGDVGIFFVNNEMLLRQYCEDSFGNVYLLTLDRRLSELDAAIPPSGQPVVCFGKVILKKKIPLLR